MKKYLSAILAVAMLVSTAALTACGGDSDSTTAPKGSSNKPSGSTVQTTDKGATTTKPAGTDEPSQTTTGNGGIDTPNVDIKYRAWVEVDNLEAFKSENTNLMEDFYDAFSEEYTIASGMDHTNSEASDVQGTKEMAPNILDMDPNSKWCCGQTEVEYVSAVVWSMKEAVTVKGYTLTTANDNTKYQDRNPVKWRLYGATELPPASMLDTDESTGMSYLDSTTVPAGWTLVDAVDATDPDADTFASLIPDQDFTEVGIALENANAYKYYMLLIDEVEGGTFQLADFTLYGTAG